MDRDRRSVRDRVDRYQADGRPEARARVVDGVVAAVVRRGLGVDRVSGACLAVHECVVNAVEHGHLGDPDLPIVVEVAGPAHDVVTVTVTDAAVGGTWDPDGGPDGGWPLGDPAGAADVGGGLTERGRGLLLAGAGVDELTVRSRPGATAVTLRWRVVEPPRSSGPSGPGPTDERR